MWLHHEQIFIECLDANNNMLKPEVGTGMVKLDAFVL
jgi:hypothetical protein